MGFDCVFRFVVICADRVRRKIYYTHKQIENTGWMFAWNNSDKP